MNMHMNARTRRDFLRFLAASPVAGALSGLGPASAGEAVTTAADAIDIFDLEETARGNIPTAHWGYLSTGVNGDDTLRVNREAFARYFVRSRRLVDISGVDPSVNILGTNWPTPIIIAPVGSQRAFHADGELGTARAARSRNHLQLLSTVSSTSIEDVAAARGEPVWFQLYTMGGWPGVQERLRRAEKAGSPVVVLTVDLVADWPDRHTLMRAARRDTRDCDSCHAGNGIAAGSKPMVGDPDDDAKRMTLTWEFLDRLRESTSMKVFVKGIVRADDARRCIDHGADGIIVSNHGGRGDDSGRGTLDSLAEVAPAVAGRVPLFMDSGIRRGVDIFKALALGADAIMVGRPYIWGLGAFGQAGVERALDILTIELKVAMQAFGTPTLADIGPDNIGVYGA